jgi:hypothetical protein
VGPHSRYLLLVALIVLVVPCVVIAMTTSSFYYEHSRYFWDPVEERQFSVRGQNADVLFFGDSSLTFGVSPQQIRQETGLSAYSLGVPMPAFAIHHERLLRQYLAHNKAPKLMVLYVAATLRTKPPYAGPPAWYEAETMLLRYGQWQQVAEFFLGNAEEISRFTALAGRRILTFDWSGRRYREQTKALDDGHGYIPSPKAATLATDNCPLSKSQVVPDQELVRWFRQVGIERGISTAVYLAPSPDCNRAFAQTSSIYAKVVDNVPYTLPHRLFVDDTQREHLVSDGAQQNSRIVSAFLNHFMTAPQIRQAQVDTD